MLLMQGINSGLSESPAAIEAALSARDEEEDAIRRLLWIKDEIE